MSQQRKPLSKFSNTGPKYSNKELRNKSVEELKSIKNKLQQSKGRTNIRRGR